MADRVIPAPATGGHQVKKQFYPNACGAVCLLCAALETGHTRYSAIAKCPARDLQNDFGSENALYYITSGAAAAGKDAGSLAAEGYSMPSMVIEAARHIGFQNATVYIRTTLSSAILKAAYASEVKACKAMANVNVVEGSAAKFSKRASLGLNEYKLVVVEPFIVCLHYVLHRPDGSYMDPATGSDIASMPASYNRTGLSIVLS